MENSVAMNNIVWVQIMNSILMRSNLNTFLSLFADSSLTVYRIAHSFSLENMHRLTPEDLNMLPYMALGTQ